MPLPSHLRLNAFKYPLAFIRLLQLLFVVIALSSINGWDYSLKFECTSDNTTSPRSVAFSTFSFNSIKTKGCFDDSEYPIWNEEDGYSSSSGFFYFVQALALISLLGAIFLYVVLWELYTDEGRIRLGDLALTALCFLLFFFSTSIWWSSCNGIGATGSKDNVISQLTNNEHFFNGVAPPLDSVIVSASNSLLTISVLCGWVLVGLFAVNCWYIWKEITPTSATNPTSIA